MLFFVVFAKRFVFRSSEEKIRKMSNGTITENRHYRIRTEMERDKKKRIPNSEDTVQLFL